MAGPERQGRDDLLLAQILGGGRQSQSPFGQPTFSGFGDVPLAGGGLAAPQVLKALLSRMGGGGGGGLQQLLSRLSGLNKRPLNPNFSRGTAAATAGAGALGLGSQLSTPQEGPGSILTDAFGDVGGGGGISPGPTARGEIGRLIQEFETINQSIPTATRGSSIANLDAMRERQAELKGLIEAQGFKLDVTTGRFVPDTGDDGPVSTTVDIGGPDAAQRLFDLAMEMGDYAGADKIRRAFLEDDSGLGGGLTAGQAAQLRSNEQAQQGTLMQQGQELMAALLPYLMDPGQQTFPGFAGGGAVPRVPVQHQQINPQLAAQWLASQRGGQ